VRRLEAEVKYSSLKESTLRTEYGGGEICGFGECFVD
jgi:hypothetical protein